MLNKNFYLKLGIYSYIALPFLLFAAGFLKWYFSIFFTIAIIAGVILSAKASENAVLLNAEKKDIPKIICGILFITVIVLLSGIGNVMWQNNDHATRNTIFDILVNQPWPPKYITDAGNEVGLVYYIGFWLPAAALGKFFSLEAGYIFQVVWAVLGLCILWYLLCVIHKKIVIYPLVIFMFFSGADIIGHMIISSSGANLSDLQIGSWAFSQGSSMTKHLEWWPNFFQYSSHITQLFWVFNQCLPVWLATLLLIVEKNNKNLVFIMGLTLLSSTLPFIGLIPIFIWCAVCDHDGDTLNRSLTKDIKASFFSLFTVQNVVGGGISGIISFLYLRGNIASQSTTSQSASGTSEAASTFSLPAFIMVVALWVLAFCLLTNIEKIKKTDVLYLIPAIPLAFLAASLSANKLRYYILFVLLEILILAIPLWWAHKKSSLYFLSVVCLLLIPFFIVGKSIDFCMRASIPLLAVLCVFASTALSEYMREKKHLQLAFLIIVLLLGSVTPMMEIARTIEATKYEIFSKGRVENDNKTTHQVFGGRNFTGKTENNIFFEIFAK